MAANLTQSVPALQKGLSVLEALAQSRNGLTLPEIVQLTGIARSSAHCLLITFLRCGYLHRNDRTSRYMFSLKCTSLLNSAVWGLRLREQGTPCLRDLMQATQCTVHMGVLENREGLVVAKQELPSKARLASWVGKRVDLHSTALGKALLAFRSDEELGSILRDRALPRHNENTISSMPRLRSELVRVRQLGYSIDDEEHEIGVRCIAAPVYDTVNRVSAAVSISGTTAEIRPENIPGLAERLLKTATVLSGMDAGALLAS
ncbi:MAG: IclR family transcriptional regulator [Acidobacteria bacterium]|nr:IclR family transcriptional regulator [Acidobacteriota bacterium]